MNIAIFASGAGSNAAVIIKNLSTFIGSNKVSIALILTNNENAGVINIAKTNNIAFVVMDFKSVDLQNISSYYLTILAQYKIDFIVLAGYLKKIPVELVQEFPQKIVNIHPALLPAYGGKGMYGMRVHEAVIAAKEKKSGITIHYVDEVYDHGKIIFQATCNLEEGETAETLAKKINVLEHKHYSEEIFKILLSQIPVK